MEFDVEKNGYNIKQVDNYVRKLKDDYEKTMSDQKIRISDLKRELETVKTELNQFKRKNNDISSALVVAVETAKQIESSSKNVYELEIKRLKNLYSKWENLFNDILKENPSMKDKYDPNELLQKFSDQIDKVIAENGIVIDDKPITQPVGIRNLISKMGGLTAKRIEPEKTVAMDKVEPKYEKSIQEPALPKPSADDYPRTNSQLRIKPIANMTSDKKEKFDNLIDKFFNEPEEEDNAYSRALIRQKKSNGFDLKEALNPTEDLAEIMKDFDFFNDNKKK